MTTQQIEFVERFVKEHGQGLVHPEREDLRQDIFVALLQYCRADDDLDIARFIAEAVLVRFRQDHQARNIPARCCSPTTLDLSFLTIDSSLDLKAAIDSLPHYLKELAIDLFYRDLSQREVGFKYHRSQTWVSDCRKEVVQLMYNYLTGGSHASIG